jgi:hypothetical protein
MSEMIQPRGKVTVYAAGGAGINIANSLDGRQPASDPTYAQMDISYIDTSRANLKGKSINPDAIYLIGGDHEEKDGSGKKRDTHFEDIKDCTGDILQKYPAGDLSIVINSLSGGSGSVIGPLLVRALVKAGKPVIAVAIVTTTSKTEIENSLNTLKSYEGIVSALNAPVTLALYHNNADTPRTVVDNEVRGLVASLMMLYSRQNTELDSQDLFNWLRFDRRTSFEPQLSALEVVHQDYQAKVEGEVISVATLTTPDIDAQLTTIPEYHCQGFVMSAEATALRSLPRHYFITSNFFARTNKMLLKYVEQFGQQREARTKRNTMLTNNDVVDDTGMVGV